MDDMKEALDKAAASSDQAVRNMAIRYREMQNEFNQYESFFTIYKQGIKSNGVTTSVRPPTIVRERNVTPKVSVTSRSDKVDTFGLSVQAILLAAGHPLKLNDLYTTYQEQHPEDQTIDGTFRQRLVKRRDIIPLIKGQNGGYWWHDTPLPGDAPAVDV